MDDFRWIKLLLLIILMLQFTGALSRQLQIYYTVRDGDDVTLSCENVLDDHRNCHSTTWLFSDSRNTAVTLFENMNIHKDARNKSDRLNVTTNCSLVIKKVTDEDVGLYTCRQFDKSGRQQGPDAVVVLSVVTMTEHKDNDQVLTCSVRTNGQCIHSVKWLYRNQDVDKDNKEVITSQSSCSASVKFLTSHYIYTSRYKLFNCQVTTETNEVQLFTFSRRPSGEDTQLEISTLAPTEAEHSTENNIRGGINSTESPTNDTSRVMTYVLYIIAAVVLVALLIIAVIVIRWKRSKGKKTPKNHNVGLTSNPAETESAPGTSQDMADPEDGVSYASISYTKNTNSRDKVRRKTDDDDDEGDAVTYSTVKASSADLYATVK